MMLSARLAEDARRPVGAVAVAVGAALVVVAIALTLLEDVLDRTAERARTHETLTRLVARGRDVGPKSARVDKLFAADPYLTGASDVLAANALQRHVAALAADARVVIRSIGREARADDPGGVPTIALRIEAEGATGDVQKLLYLLETGTPFLMVDGLVLRPAAGADASADADRLAVDLVIVGFRRRPETR